MRSLQTLSGSSVVMAFKRTKKGKINSFTGGELDDLTGFISKPTINYENQETECLGSDSGNAGWIGIHVFLQQQ
jgi:hypothetical protein